MARPGGMARDDEFDTFGDVSWRNIAIALIDALRGSVSANA
jgi:hypothetical protein